MSNIDAVEVSVPYNKMIVKITDQIQDCFDGHESTGLTDGPDSGEFTFQTNFNKSMLPMYLDMFGEIGFPDGTVGICEQATGFNDDEGYSFPVPECYGLYFLYGAIPDEMMAKFGALSNAKHKAYYDRLWGPTSKKSLAY